MKYHIIYKTTNSINGKIYIGKHSQEGLEFDGYLGSGFILKLAIKKYGRDNFIREILELVDGNKLLIKEKEMFWIERLNSRNREIGYNITKGGSGGDTFSNRDNQDITRKKISKKSKEYSNRPEVKERVSKETSENWNDPIWREKQLKIQKVAANEPKRLEKISKKSKEMWKVEEYRELHTKRMIGNDYKLKYHYVLKDPQGNIVETDNLNKLCKQNNLTQSALRHVCVGNYSQHKGWTCVSMVLIN